MDAETFGAILQAVFRQWGLVSLFILVLCASVSVSIVQVMQIRAWAPETRRVATILLDIAAKLERQHNTCTRHYDFAQTQIQGMHSIGEELKAVVESITQSDRERTKEIMQLMTVIASRHVP